MSGYIAGSRKDIGHPESAKHIFCREYAHARKYNLGSVLSWMQRALRKQNTNLEFNLTDKEG